MTQKNILLLFPDQHRGDWMPYGPQTCQSLGILPLPLRMQNLRSLMECGTTFTHAATNSPLCVPARACLALGRGYESCGAWNNSFCCPTDQPTFYRVLRDGGYAVAGVGKFDLHKPIMYWGEDGWTPQLGLLGFTQAVENEGKGDAVWAYRHTAPGPYGAFLAGKGLMEEYCADHLRRAKNPTDSEASDIPAWAYADNWVTDHALAAMHDLTKKDRPWFLMVNFSGPHDPWDITPAMKQEWENTDFPLPQDYTGSKAALLAVRQNYAAMVENIDRNIGRILDLLRRSGQLENTIVIYCSDHGEMLGDRNRYYKSLPYRPAVQIPLIISGPDVRRNCICDELVQLNDLAATITEFAGLEMPKGVDSRSLKPLATQENAPPVRDYQYAALYTNPDAPEENLAAYSEYHAYRKGRSSDASRNTTAGWRSVITKTHKYIEFLGGQSAELYDLRCDPWEQQNLAETYPALLAHFHELLQQELTREGGCVCPS